MKLENLENIIENVRPEEWEKLFSFIPFIRENEKYGELKVRKNNTDETTQMPYFVKDEIIKEFLHLIYKLNLVVDFNWAEWEPGREIIENRNFQNLDMLTLIKIITSIVRKDRFCDGVLVKAFEDGTIKEILTEIKKNYENTARV